MLKYFGAMCIGSGFSVLLPLLSLIFFPQELYSLYWYAIPGSVSIICGYLCINIHKARMNKNLSDNTYLLSGQSAFVVLIGWIVAIICNAMPFIISKEYTVSQSFFEAISGLTTTGLSIVDVDNCIHIILIHRSIMLFFGGVGIVLTVLFFIKDKGGLRLYFTEGHNDMLLPNVLKSSRMIILIYSFYIITGIVLYMCCGMNFFDAFNHSIAALSTGGFSTHSQSIGYFNSNAINIVTIILMLLGSTNFLIQFLLITGKFKNIISYSETKLCFCLIFIFVPILSYCFYLHNPNEQSFITALFQVVSAITTTGFQTVDSFNGLPSCIIFCMIILMLIGGGTGSTAGGIKQYRIYIAIKDLFWTIKENFGFKKTIYPHCVYKQKSLDTIDTEHRKQILSFIFIYMLLFIIGTFILSLSGNSISDCMFEIASSLGTVGLSSGIISPTCSSYILWTCSVAMFLGRLEIYVFIFGVVYGVKKIFK